MAGEIIATDLEQLTSLAGNEQFVMFDTETGKRASVQTVSDYVESKMTFPNAHGTNLYGAKWDRLSKNMTRTRDASSITTTTTDFCHKGSINANYDNPFDSIYPWSEMTVCNVDLTKYRLGYSPKDCITATYGDPDFTYYGTEDLFVGRYRPEFWYKSQEDESGNVEYLISQNERVGFSYSPEVIDGISLCIDAGNSKVKTGSGVPLANVAVSTMHARAKSTGYTLMDIYDIDSIIALYLVEYANMNIQNALGDGCVSCYRQNAVDTIESVSTTNGVSVITVDDSALSSYIYKGTQLSFGASTGATTYKAIVADFSVNGTIYTITLDRELSSLTSGMYISIHGFDACEFPIIGSSLGNMSGYLGVNGKANVYYRGSFIFGNRYIYILGIYRQTATNRIWRCPDTKSSDDYDALNTTDHVDTGVSLPTLTSGAWITVGGNAKRLPGLECFMVCGDTSSGNSSDPVGDQQYVPVSSTGNTILLFGGGALYGWFCGVFFGGWSDAAGASYWASAALPILK